MMFHNLSVVMVFSFYLPIIAKEESPEAKLLAILLKRRIGMLDYNYNPAYPECLWHYAEFQFRRKLRDLILAACEDYGILTWDSIDEESQDDWSYPVCCDCSDVPVRLGNCIDFLSLQETGVYRFIIADVGTETWYIRPAPVKQFMKEQQVELPENYTAFVPAKIISTTDALLAKLISEEYEKQQSTVVE